MRWLALSLLIAIALLAGVAPGALAHEPSPEELEVMIASVSEVAWNARTLALVGLVAGLAGLAAGVISLRASLRGGR